MLLHPLLGGHEVGAVIRNPDQSEDVVAAGATPVVADVGSMDVDELTGLLHGYDLVLWSAGAGGGDPERTIAVDRDAAIRTMDAAERAGVDRYLMVSYLGARLEHGVPEDNAFFTYAEAKAAADAHLRSTDLDWTIIAPGALSLDEPTGQIEVLGDGSGQIQAPEGRTVSRADVAAVIAAVIGRDDLAGTMIEFLGGDVPIDEALEATAA